MLYRGRPFARRGAVPANVLAGLAGADGDGVIVLVGHGGLLNFAWGRFKGEAGLVSVRERSPFEDSPGIRLEELLAVNLYPPCDDFLLSSSCPPHCFFSIITLHRWGMPRRAGRSRCMTHDDHRGCC